MGGKWGGRKLQAPSSDALRPTAGRVKQAIFSILESHRMKTGEAPEFTGVRCLDLFAGVGGLGLEAMSRGADFVVFVEKNRRHALSLKSNLKILGAEPLAEVISFGVENFDEWHKRGPYQLVFCDPPYALGVEPKVLDWLSRPGVLSEGAVVVMEHDPKTELSTPTGWELHSRRKLGPAGLTIFFRAS